MQLTSPEFRSGAFITSRFTCDGENISPKLEFADVPAGARSLVLLMDDPDAPGGCWTHWVVADLPATCVGLPEAQPRTQFICGGSPQGINDFGHLGYGGPCPPRGKPHRYFFRLYALDAELAISPGQTKAVVEAALKSHVLAASELIGLYART